MPDRSAYDEFMLRFHHYLEGNADFQQTGGRQRTAFHLGETWVCFTYRVAHAVLSGQYAVEQTCIVSRASLQMPERSPLAVLERLAGRPLV